jgi:LacI family transcriptional regulator
MAISLKDLAREAGVSVMTVYRALNDYPDIQAETKRRILNIARQRRYRPNLLAKGLIKGETNTIGLIVPAINNPYITSHIYFIDKLLAESNRSLLLEISHNDPEHQSKNIMEVCSRMVDGLIIIPIHNVIPYQEISDLAEENFPLVILSQKAPPGVSYVTVDLEQGAYDAVKYLIELGHRRIVHISLPRIEHTATKTDFVKPEQDGRLIGYMKALRTYGIDFIEDYVIDCENTIEAGYRMVSELLKVRPRPTAVFLYNDNVAIGLLNGLLQAGINVPQDMSVIGFDDVELSRLLPVPLTTMGQFIELEATELVNLVLEQIMEPQSQRKPRYKLIPTELIARASTGPPPQVSLFQNNGVREKGREVSK